jgi:hypothetical protein
MRERPNTSTRRRPLANPLIAVVRLEAPGIERRPNALTRRK